MKTIEFVIFSIKIIYFGSCLSEDATVVWVLVIVPLKRILVRLTNIIRDELPGQLSVKLKLGQQLCPILFTLPLQLLLLLAGFAAPRVHYVDAFLEDFVLVPQFFKFLHNFVIFLRTSLRLIVLNPLSDNIFGARGVATL